MKNKTSHCMSWLRSFSISRPLLGVLSCVIVTTLFSGEKNHSPEGIQLTKTQVSSGDAHHLFGYIGQSLTIPWNASDRYIVALQTDFHDRLPGPGDAADVVLIDTHNDNAMVVLDQTFGWNLQQGTMFYWNPAKPETQFFFNDRDPIDGRVFTVLYDIEVRKRIREFRYENYSVGNSGVAPVGTAFAAINYGRMASLRPVTGYAGAMDETVGEKAPENDGIFIIDSETGREQILVSFKQLASLIKTVPHWEVMNKRWTPVASGEPEAEKPDTSEAALYINHTLFNRGGDRIFFFVRGRREKRSIWMNVPCSIKTDGTELVVHTTFIGGHPEWGEGDVLIGANEGRQVFYDVIRQEILPDRTLGDTDIFPKPEGDVSLSPDGKWFVNGYASEDRETIHYVVMRLSDEAFVRSDSFDRGPYTKGDLRTDPAPRWNRASDAILVPGWTDDGTRQLFVLKIDQQP
jgi:hypothetical protein